MINNPTMLFDYPAARLSTRSDKTEMVVWGYVVSIDKQKQQMMVKLQTTEQEVPVRINNHISRHGFGVRFIPVPRDTIVILLKVNEDYLHIGYALENIEQYTQDSSNSKTTIGLLQRYLDEGEVQLLGIGNNELLLSNDGSVLIKTQSNAYIKLEDISSTMEGHFANMKMEMDGVRVRAGNMRRPLKGAQREDDYLVMKDEDGSVSKVTDLEEQDGELEDHSYMKEFTVQVGTIIDPETGIDKKFDQRDPASSSPQIGWFSLANKVVDETGEEYKLEGKNVQFVLRTANGGGLAVTEDNSLYILDYSPGTSGGKNFTKFSSTKDSKALRASEDNLIDLSDAGIRIFHKKANIDIKLDEPDGDPEINISTGDGRGIILNKMGIYLNASKSYVTIDAKEIQLNAESVTFGGMNAAVTGDTVFKAKQTATELDMHTHAGPAGPPTQPLIPKVLAGSIVPDGFNVG